MYLICTRIKKIKKKISEWHDSSNVKGGTNMERDWLGTLKFFSSLSHLLILSQLLCFLIQF